MRLRVTEGWWCCGLQTASFFFSPPTLLGPPRDRPRRSSKGAWDANRRTAKSTRAADSTRRAKPTLARHRKRGAIAEHGATTGFALADVFGGVCRGRSRGTGPTHKATCIARIKGNARPQVPGPAETTPSITFILLNLSKSTRALSPRADSLLTRQGAPQANDNCVWSAQE